LRANIPLTNLDPAHLLLLTLLPLLQQELLLLLLLLLNKLSCKFA